MTRTKPPLVSSCSGCSSAAQMARLLNMPCSKAEPVSKRLLKTWKSCASPRVRKATVVAWRRSPEALRVQIKAARVETASNTP